MKTWRAVTLTFPNFFILRFLNKVFPKYPLRIVKYKKIIESEQHFFYVLSID